MPARNMVLTMLVAIATTATARQAIGENHEEQTKPGTELAGTAQTEKSGGIFSGFRRLLGRKKEEPPPPMLPPGSYDEARALFERAETSFSSSAFEQLAGGHSGRVFEARSSNRPDGTGIDCTIWRKPLLLGWDADCVLYLSRLPSTPDFFDEGYPGRYGLPYGSDGSRRTIECSLFHIPDSVRPYEYRQEHFPKMLTLKQTPYGLYCAGNEQFSLRDTRDYIVAEFATSGRDDRAMAPRYAYFFKSKPVLLNEHHHGAID